MGILRYNYRSEVLGMHTDITITYPSGQYTCYTPEKEGNSIFKRGNLRYKPDMKLPTVYILHGGGDDDSLLYRYTRLEYYAEQNQVMTVTAQAHDSFLSIRHMEFHIIPFFQRSFRWWFNHCLHLLREEKTIF